MNETEITRQVLISAQKALLGMIYPSIRAIAIGFTGLESFKSIYYLDREPNEIDYENISDFTAQVCADINFIQVEETCIFAKVPISQLNSLDFWVYVREEKNV